MNRILISIALLLVVYVINGCIGTGPATISPTASATATDPAPTATPLPASPTVVLAQPTRGIILTPQIPPPIDTAPTRPVETVIADPTLLKLVNEAKADLTTRANVLPDEIKVKSAEAVEWRDASLGCPIPGVMYAQVITPGYLIVLETAGQEWNYHASTTQVMYCDQ